MMKIFTAIGQSLRFRNGAYRYSFASQEQQSQLFNPFTKQFISRRNYIKQDQLFTKLSTAFVSYRKWNEVKLNDRIDLVSKFVQSIINDKNMLKPIIAAEIGKSFADIEEEFRRVQYCSKHLIESGRHSLKSQIVHQSQGQIKKITYESIGLSLVFPYFSEPIFDSLINLIPCLISGNGALIKSSDFNHFLGPYLENKSKQIFGRSALIADIFIQPRQLSSIAEFRSIKKVLYSGSPESAKSIFQTLVRNRFIDCNLFFGGQDAAYVDESADLQHAAKQIVKNAYYNNGQSYDCIKRLYMDSKIQDKLLQLLRTEIQKIVIGDPTNPQVHLGPLCSPQNASIAQKYISDSVSEGAVCQIGGLVTNNGQNGVFLQPTLLSQCTNDMIIAQTQLNAPILCGMTFDNVKGGQSLAQEVNENEFGTGVRIFTQDEERYKQMIDQLQVGRISFNSGSLFDSNLPIEGWKKSGKGKLLSQLSFEQFSIPKSYNIKKL